MADNCPFIHVQKYENQDIPEDELAQILLQGLPPLTFQIDQPTLIMVKG